jgi:UDP-glucose 4-epimerase
MKKKIIIVTGGAGFIGSNLIEKILNISDYEIISIDNYSSGSKKNHLKHKRVKYIKADTKNISKVLHKKKDKINCIFHFGEFSRIYQSFLKLDECIDSNISGSKSVIKFCLKNKIKLVYSATSASLGSGGEDKNLSPYAFTKATNLEYLKNLKRWFDFKFEVIYFYNVYGPRQICKGNMATVIGIFKEQYENNAPITVVKPGSQSRKFTHVYDTVEACIDAWKKNKNLHYFVAAKKSHSILQVAKLFSNKIKFLPKRLGERYKSSIMKKDSNNIVHIIGKRKLVDYIEEIKINKIFKI